MGYVDAIVAAVPEDNRDRFLLYARRTAGMMRELGAMQVVECWGDDVPDGQITSFPMAVKAGPGEAVALSWILWPSRAVRDAAWARIMAEPALRATMDGMPFDGARLIHGGFRQILIEG